MERSERGRTTGSSSRQMATGRNCLDFRIDPATGAETLVGSTGLHFIGDLDFRPVPEPGTWVLIPAGLAVFAFRLLRRIRS